MSGSTRTGAGVDPARVAGLHADAVATFRAQRPRSRALHERAGQVMPGGVPMS